MRASFTSLFIVLLTTTCVNPLKLLEAQEFDRAYKVSKRQLDQRIRRDKPATVEQLVALQDSYAHLQDRAIQQISRLQGEGRPSRWLSIYPLYAELLERHLEVQTYTHLFTHFSFHYDLVSLQRLTEQARLNAGTYCFEQAASSFPAARANQKNAARIAYSWLRRALEYVPEDNDYLNYLAEMRDLGTVRILVQNLDYINPVWNSLEAAFPPSGARLYQRDWLEVNYRNSARLRIDYEATMEVTGLRISGDEERRSRERFREKVITGYRTETKKVWQDSVWVEKEEKVPIYVTVRATIITVEQYKEAWGSAQIQLTPRAGRRPGEWWNTYERVDWSNTYEICSGDDRALPRSCRGYRRFFPSDREMVFDLGRALRWNLIQHLCNYFPDTRLLKKERRALGW